MKLKNKKTGEIGYLIVGKGNDHYVVANDEWENCGNYGSLAELNEEWEDAPEEEPEIYWYIDSCGGALQEYFDGGCIDIQRKQIGNYFETEEEAEKAIEKLKAYKRLKDKGFKFSDIDWIHNCIRYGVDILTGQITFDPAKSELEGIKKDLDLLFGGED